MQLMALDCTDAVEAVLQMSQAALFVKNQAIDTLSTELDQLKRENELLVQLASAKGGSQVPQLIRSLQQAQLEAQQMNQQLQEEVNLREDLERELEDTAAAAKELWDSMQAVYSDAVDSRANSIAGSPQSEQEEWGTPERAVSPVEGLTQNLNGLRSQREPSIAEAAAAALARSAETGTSPSKCNTTITTAAEPSTLNREALAAVDAAAAQSPAAHGILTPLENKLQSLSNKLVGLVSWLDARECSSTPGSTPRGATPASTVVTPTGSVSSSRGRRGAPLTPRLGSISPVHFNREAVRISLPCNAASPEKTGAGKLTSNSAGQGNDSPGAVKLVSAAGASVGGDDDDVRVKDSSPVKRLAARRGQ